MGRISDMEEPSDKSDSANGFDERQSTSLARPASKHRKNVEDEKPHYLGHRERLRQKFNERGSAALAEYELLEMLLFRPIRQGDTKPLAKALIAEFGSLAGVLSASPQRLTEVKGVGEAIAADLKIIHAAGLSLSSGDIQKRPLLGSWSKVLEHCRAVMAFEEREIFRILFLDKKNQLIKDI